MAYFLRNQSSEVLACAGRAAKNWQQISACYKAYAIQLRGLGHTLRKDYPSAIVAFHEALKIQISIAPESDDVAITLNSLANTEKRNKDFDAAERNYREALRIANKISDDEGKAIYTGNIADLALDREQCTDAESFAREALELSRKIGRQELIAGNCNTIAKSLLKQNKNLEEALTFAQRAVEIYTNLRHPDLPEALQTLAEIEKAMSGE